VGNSSRQAGLTLMELLVTLVIAAAATAILGQALTQVYRIEAVLADERLRGQTVLLPSEWVRQALAGLLPGDASGRGRLRGNERSLEGTTSNPISQEGGGYGTVNLRLRFDENSGQTLLEMPVAPDRYTALLQWPGNSGEFRYIRANGQIEYQWPPPLGVQEALPVAVVIQTGLAGFGVLVAAPAATERIQVSRRDLQQL